MSTEKTFLLNVVKRREMSSYVFLVCTCIIGGLGPTFGSFKKGACIFSWNIHTNIFKMQNIHWASCSFYQFLLLNFTWHIFTWLANKFHDVTWPLLLCSIADNFYYNILAKDQRYQMEGLQEFQLPWFLYLADTKIEEMVTTKRYLLVTRRTHVQFK